MFIYIYIYTHCYYCYQDDRHGVFIVTVELVRGRKGATPFVYFGLQGCVIERSRLV